MVAPCKSNLLLTALLQGMGRGEWMRCRRELGDLGAVLQVVYHHQVRYSQPLA